MAVSYCIKCFQQLNGMDICPYCGYSNAYYRPKPFWLPVGARLNGRYSVGAALGEDGSAVTYAGFDMQNRRSVIIQEYFPAGCAQRAAQNSLKVVGSQNPELRRRFEAGRLQALQTAQALARLNNAEAIARALDFFPENETAYLITEDVAGESLRAYVKNRGGRLAETEAAALFLPLLRALRDIHACGMLHRNITPENIAVTPRRQAKLTGFGEWSSAAPDHGCASPELAAAQGGVGPWSDVYSVCAVLFYTVTGTDLPPSFRRVQSDTAAYTLQRYVSPQMQAVLLKGLAVQAQARCRDMNELISALEKAAPHPAAPYTAGNAVNTDPFAAEDPQNGFFMPPTQAPAHAEEEKTVIFPTPSAPPQKPADGFFTPPMQAPMGAEKGTTPLNPPQTPGISAATPPARPAEEKKTPADEAVSPRKQKERQGKKNLWMIFGVVSAVLAAALAVVLVIVLLQKKDNNSDASPAPTETQTVRDEDGETDHTTADDSAAPPATEAADAAETPAAPADIKKPETKAEIIAFYKTAVNEICDNGAAGYTKKTWQYAESFNITGNSLVDNAIKNNIGDYYVTEDNAKEKVYAKGSKDAGSNIPGWSLTDENLVKSAALQENNGNYEITLVMEDEDTPHQNGAGLQQMGEVLLWEDIDDTLKGISALKEYSDIHIIYKNYTVTAVISPDGKLSELRHTADVEIKVGHAKVVFLSIDDKSMTMQKTVSFYDFKY